MSLWITLAILGLAITMGLSVIAKRMQYVHKATSGQYLILLGWVSLAVLSSFALYAHFGASHQLALYDKEKSQASIVQAEIKKLKSPRQVIAQLKRTLQAHPDSAGGWYLLGRLYMGMSNYPLAEQVMKKAYAIDSKRHLMLWVMQKLISLIINKIYRCVCTLCYSRYCCKSRPILLH